MKINWRRELIDYYIDMLQRRERFAFAGYSDAETFCIINHNIGKRTGLGQTMDSGSGVALLDIIRRRHVDKQFKFAVPDCMWKLEDFINAKVGSRFEEKMSSEGVKEIDFYERDMVTDDLTKNAGLYPFIEEIRKQRVVLIGNKCLRDLDIFDNDFVEVSSPNQHLDERGLSGVIRRCRKIRGKNLFLVSAGISAALIIDMLYDVYPEASFFDCGSMWDAFVGIGCQREWRRRLYMNPNELLAWRHKNLHG